MEIVIVMALFAASMGAMSVGVMLSGRRLRGSCGGPSVVGANGEEISCGACPKKEATVCPSDEPLVQLAQIAHPNPKHHR